MDNLDGAIQEENAKTENEGREWTPEEDTYLREQFAQGVTTKDMGLVLKCTAGTVRARLKKLGIV